MRTGTRTFNPNRQLKEVFVSNLSGSSMLEIAALSAIVPILMVLRQCWGSSFVSDGSWGGFICCCKCLGFKTSTKCHYSVHVGEYGVHWSFFFTLAAVSFLTSIFSSHSDYCGVLGLIILTGYQMCLSCGLNKYLLSNQRSNHILSQNKEGICSIFGYWGTYLIGLQLGHYLFFKPFHISQKEIYQWAKMRVWVLCSSLWLLTVIFDMFIERVSRRMCNLAYVTLVFAQNLQVAFRFSGVYFAFLIDNIVLAIFMLSDFLPGSSMPVLEKAVNHELLGFFILANVLIGVINLSVDTLSASSLMSFTILVGYATILSAFAVTAMSIGIRLKFW